MENLETVNHPQHYNQVIVRTKEGFIGPVECIELIEALGLNFNLGNTFKYIWRFKDKSGLEDLKKARFYLDREIGNLES
jgi:hypothetical protein